ncbi:MAG: histidine kinase [Bdellovibrionales bacterium RIFCSPHIGHO2_01_FULL_40_29]|nr:MAG: histidine kinase [Bdellovibrionales bacterium RIFCSPHIGHO2_01_FULL_40_29]OFZ33871.1 MAG: histidine kinase [Bdellovibrionales bacterium RIFCSPHIGHO2_02_FULL_40_15]
MKKLKLPVEEFTTPNPVTAVENTALDDLENLMTVHGVRHIPITRDGLIVGIVSDRDLRVAGALSMREKMLVLAKDIMVSNPVTVNSGASLDDVAFQMSKNKIGSVIVNDESDEFFGIFTSTDALNALIEIVRSEKSLQ